MTTAADTVVMGTPRFAPPEQFGYRKTDERSDLYAAGVLLRYMLTQETLEEEDRNLRLPFGTLDLFTWHLVNWCWK